MSSSSDAAKDGGKSMLDPSTNVYEMQLTQIQEQLIAAMIDNETLKSELKELKEKHKVDNLIQELDYERKKSRHLYEELQKAQRSKSDRRVPAKEDVVDLAQEATEDIDLEKDIFPRRKVFWFESIRDYFISALYEFIADFTEAPVDEPEVEEELAVKQLKENIARFKGGIRPVFQFFKACYRLLSWKSPLSTLFIFIVYMYNVWSGWLVPVILLLAIFALTVNYLKTRGCNINFGCFVEDDENSEKNDDLARAALSEKFNLVLLVAKQVQNTLGKIADGLEKIKNLLTWQHASSSSQLYRWLCLALFMSCIMSGPMLFKCIAFYLGLKMFFINYIYDRFPRFKYRHDSTYRMWLELPTDADLEKQHRKFLIDQQIIGKNRDSSEIDVVEAYEPGSELTRNTRDFCSLFGLPLSERPLPGWEGGWRVTLLDKSRPFLKSLSRNGRLYLTNSFLCLERYKTLSPKNIMIPLKDITRVEKAKPYGWFPGSGMSIEINLTGFEQPYTFGGILNRDECFLRLIRHGAKVGLRWAVTEKASAGKRPMDKVETTEARASPEKLPLEKSFRMSDLQDSIEYEDLTTFGS